MSLHRDDAIYVNWQTRRRLKWIAQSRENELPARNDSPPHPSRVTADQVADELLNEVIESRYPQIKDAEKNLKQAEDTAIAALRPQTATTKNA